MNREPVNMEMPKKLGPVKVLVFDDALEPEEIEDEALATEAGFTRYLELREEFRENLQKIVSLGVNFILVDRGIHDIAEEILTDAGILVLQRVAIKNGVVQRHTERNSETDGLKKTGDELQISGEAGKFIIRKAKHVRYKCSGKAPATILVGASTEEW